jgi:hypothetical protein
MYLLLGGKGLTQKMGTTSTELDFPIYSTILYFHHTIMTDYLCYMGVHKSKAIPLQAWTGPQGSRKLRLPDFKTTGT